jgi:hypothetical protein
MLNPWNDLIKQETNNNVGSVNGQNMIYENDNNNMIMLGGNAPSNSLNMVSNGMPSMDSSNGHIPSQAQVAAAVATAMMMQNQNNGLNK